MTTPTITLDAATAVDQLARAARALRGAAAEREPEAPYPVPHQAGAYTEAPDLESLAAELIDRHEATFGHLAELTVRVLWKAKAGKANGKTILGKCQRPGKSSLLGHYEPADFIIWIAAEVARGMTARQVEAALFSQLLCTGADDEGRPVLYGPDFAGFRKELAVYGLWRQDLKLIPKAVQGSLFADGGDEDGDDDE